METKSSWLVLLLGVILTVGSSEGTTGCSKILTKNIPVAHMCKDNAVLDVQHLFLEAFVSTNISIVCNCSLYATTHLRLGFNNAQLPEKNCGSIVTIKEPKKTLKYQCRSGTPQQYKHAINNKGYTIQLETGYSRKDISYCFDFYVIEGPGNLSMKCYPSNGYSASNLSTNSINPTGPISVVHTSSPVSSTQSGILRKNSPSSKWAQSSSNQESFPVAGVAGGVGAVVIIVVVVIIVTVLMKRKFRNKKHGPGSDKDEDYCNLDADPYKDQNTNSSGNQPGDPANYQHQNRAQKTLSVAGDYASIEDEPTSITHRPQMAIEPNIPSTSGHDELEPELGQDQVSNMYAKVDKGKPGKSLTGDHLPAMHEPNKPSTSGHGELEPELGQDQISNMYAKVDKRKPGKTLTGVHQPVMHANQLYSSVGEAETSDQSLEVGPSGDVYAVVNKKKKSGGKSNGSNSAGKGPQPKGKDSESEANGSKSKDSETTGDIYTEVRKPKKHAKPSDS